MTAACRHTHQLELTPVHLEISLAEVSLKLAAFEVSGAGHAGPERAHLLLKKVQLAREGRPAGQSEQGARVLAGPGHHGSRTTQLQPGEYQIIAGRRPQHLQPGQVRSGSPSAAGQTGQVRSDHRQPPAAGHSTYRQVRSGCQVTIDLWPQQLLSVQVRSDKVRQGQSVTTSLRSQTFKWP